MSSSADDAKSPVDQFLEALRSADVSRTRALLEQHAAVRASVNEPIGDFGSRPVAAAKKHVPMVDLLLDYGADLNLKSTWWAGGFGLLEYDCTPGEAAPLIERGAVVDVFAASHLGLVDRVQALIASDSSLVRARGGDGKTPLHCARTVEIARYLVDCGADLDARDVDHESTPAQYLIRDAPEVVRFLVDRGAWFDVFIAAGLRDTTRVEECLRDDAHALNHRTGRGLYAVAHNGRRAATAAEIGARRGDIYRWVFGPNLSVVEAASQLGYRDIVASLLRLATPDQRLIAACATADRAEAHAVIASHPNVLATLTPDGLRLMSDKAQANETASVALMLEIGFDARVSGPDFADALHWASFLGNAEMVRALLQHNPPIGVRDAEYDGTPLRWCLHGARHGWARMTGDFATTATLLIQAGEQIEASDLPTGRGDLDAILTSLRTP